ncbi:MAG: hypothetical protein KKH68_08205 [Proteobacteria bacterium]|nr:hypothetical protein [Pseudomonadota bacterium]
MKETTKRPAPVPEIPGLIFVYFWVIIPAVIKAMGLGVELKVADFRDI